MPKKKRPDVVTQLLNGDLTAAQLVSLDARQTAALLHAGHILYTEGRWRQATDIFSGLAVLDPQNPYVHGMLGAIRQQAGDLPAAVAHYTRCLELAPGDPAAWTNRGEILLQAGRLEEAARDLAEAVARDPEGRHPAAHRARLLAALTQDALRAAAKGGPAAAEEVLRALQVRLGALRDAKD
ncbi:MAG TPA: tetratricopeptide repeat protein [Acidobacteriota bacterium]|nr:tetratricopeptide repeat protein [Acidobacteriota bacterium]HQM62504.1 tetratricopeptide repeat protein [Acidobacteriota bacterium]